MTDRVLGWDIKFSHREQKKLCDLCENSVSSVGNPPVAVKHLC